MKSIVKIVIGCALILAHAAYAGPLHDAVKKGDLIEVKILLEKGAKVDEKNQNSGRTALIFAAENGHVQIVELLLKAGANVDEKDIGGTTALINAAYGGCVQVVELLLEAGASVNKKTHIEDTALMWAARNGHVQVVELLLYVLGLQALQKLYNNKDLKILKPKLDPNFFELVNWYFAGADLSKIPTGKLTEYTAQALKLKLFDADIFEAMLKQVLLDDLAVLTHEVLQSVVAYGDQQKLSTVLDYLYKNSTNTNAQKVIATIKQLAREENNAEFKDFFARKQMQGMKKTQNIGFKFQ